MMGHLIPRLGPLRFTQKFGNGDLCSSSSNITEVVDGGDQEQLYGGRRLPGSLAAASFCLCRQWLSEGKREEVRQQVGNKRERERERFHFYFFYFVIKKL